MSVKKKSKRLTHTQMWERLCEKVFDCWSPRNGKYCVQYQEGGRVYTFNQPLYEVCHKTKAITTDEYQVFAATDGRICKEEYANNKALLD